MSAPITAIVHPGEMGASVGAAAISGSEDVIWANAKRSERSIERADKAGLRATGTLAQTVSVADIVISVCPPHAAISLASEVAECGFRGLYLDANAISPATAMRVREQVQAGGARYVDGGIIGPPAWEAGITRLYLSGAHAHEVVPVFESSLLEPIIVNNGDFAASALKMTYAAWTKGSTALLANVRALAEANGVSDALLAEWRLSQSGLAERSQRAVTGSAFKAWRWIAEMHEIGDSFEHAGLPDGFHRGAAQVYERQKQFKDCDPAPSMAAILRAMLEPSQD